MQRTDSVDTIVIIGGGISGLSSAFYLQQQAKEQKKPVRIILVEGSAQLGGRINTLHKDGFVIEKGPDSFLSRKVAIIELAKELGIDHELVATNPLASKTYIMNNLKLHAMPPGLVLGIPTDIGSFLKTDLITARGKLTALADLLKPAEPAVEDESLGGFLERRIGSEMVKKIAEPLLAGIYAGDLKKLSLKATFPQFARSEQQHGSLIIGSRADRRAVAASKVQSKAVFMTFKNGLTTLVNALEHALADISVIKEAKVTRIVKESNNYELLLENGQQLSANAMIVTTPAYTADKLLSEHVNTSALSHIRYVSVANVVMAFDKATFGVEFDGSGFLVPRSEGLHITACTWTSNKWLHSAPDDKVLLRCYVGHSEDQESIKLNDEQLIAAVREDVRKAVGITVEPLFTEITRLDHSMPQYPIGHVTAVKELRTEMHEKLPKVWITGAAFDGVGLPDCIRQGKEAASIILEQL